MKTWAWIAIGLGSAAVVVTGVGVAEHYAHASSASCAIPAQFTAGHRYKAVVTSPTPNAQALPTAAQLQALVSASAGVTIVEVDPPPPGQGGLTIFFDVTSTQSSAGACGGFASTAPAGAAVAVTDMGLTPVGG